MNNRFYSKENDSPIFGKKKKKSGYVIPGLGY